MKVASSMIAVVASSFTLFYTAVVLVVGSAIRPIFLTWMHSIFIFEITNPDPIIKLIEACYIFRHEEDLYQEEESYRMLNEIIRTPGFIKALSGTCLKGELDPALDNMNEEDRKKIRHLNKLERNGFDVEALKEIVTRKYQDDYIDMKEAREREEAKQAGQ